MGVILGGVTPDPFHEGRLVKLWCSCSAAGGGCTRLTCRRLGADQQGRHGRAPAEVALPTRTVPQAGSGPVRSSPADPHLVRAAAGRGRGPEPGRATTGGAAEQVRVTDLQPGVATVVRG
ncbi:MAG: hypothetical protein M3P37_07920 [Actinomycetota bacterium]|nr:hypothetical protein [Actinomycetota bacterium]